MKVFRGFIRLILLPFCVDAIAQPLDLCPNTIVMRKKSYDYGILTLPLAHNTIAKDLEYQRKLQRRCGMVLNQFFTCSRQRK